MKLNIPRSHREKGFTLIELMVVMLIILILAGLILAIAPLVAKKQARTVAEGEIKAISAALEAYKADNGIYPNDAGLSGNNYTNNLDARTYNDPTDSHYTIAGLVLYRALSGDTNLDRVVNATDMNFDISGGSTSSQAAIPTVYYPFPPGMLLPAGGTGKVTNLIDPFGYNFGYSTAYAGDVATNNANGTSIAPTHGYNPTFDLWSTAGNIAKTGDAQLSAKRAQWIYNWQNSGANAGQ